KGRSNLADELRQEIARRKAVKNQSSAENEATTRLNGDTQAEKHQPLATDAPASSGKGRSNLADELRQEIARRKAVKNQSSAENEATTRLNSDMQAEKHQPTLNPARSSVAEKIAFFTEHEETTRKGAANQSVKPSAQQETSKSMDALPANPAKIDAGLSSRVVGSEPAGEDVAISTNPSSKAVDSSGQRLYTTWNTVDVFNRRNSINRGTYVTKHTDAKAAELESNGLQQAFVALAKKADSSSEFAGSNSVEDRTAQPARFQGLRAR
ncbi:hypothetical protein ACFFJN_00505, partial [Erwinia mallotivora]|uniref:hypothetical protein n=1 Tax=Erwinia mallotivora TaxID=69222 RepID=UPI0035ED1555